MKLFNQFNILPRYLTAFNYAGLNLNETPKELEKCTPGFQNFWAFGRKNVENIQQIKIV